MLAHILVPLDGSMLGEQALKYARQVVSPESQITLITAVELPEIPLYGFDLVGASTSPSYQATLEEILEQAKAYLQKTCEELQAEGFQVKYVVQFGEPASVIVDTAVQLHVDAIVMSTHGRSGISRWIFGSVTNKVLGSAECPVLVVPSEQRARVVPSETTSSAAV
jgi:nucleotide-binding universal stress UspA family protein